VSPEICPSRHAWVLNNWLRRLIQNPDRLLASYVRAGQVVADVGCGPGFFTIAMARLVGPTGRVIAADVQPEMFEMTRRHARRAGIEDRITFLRCERDRIGLSEPVDLVLAFYVVHEVPDRARFFAEIRSMLKPDGSFLFVEPKIHVSPAQFQESVRLATEAGLALSSRPSMRFSRACLFRPEPYGTPDRNVP